MMIINLKKTWIQQTAAYLKLYHKLIFMMASLLIGILIGSLFIRNQQITQALSVDNIFNQFVLARTTGSFFSLFIHAFLSAFFYLAISYCLGLFMFGCVPSILLPCFRGLGIGSVAAYVYSNYGLKGAAFVLFLILPFVFCHSLILLISCQEAMKFSQVMFRNYAVGVPTVNISQAFKQYQIRFLVLLFISAIIAVPDCLLSSVFIRVFGF